MGIIRGLSSLITAPKAPVSRWPSCSGRGTPTLTPPLTISTPPGCTSWRQYANNPVEADHGRLKARLRPMRGLKSHRSARILAAGHVLVQNLRRGHYDIAAEVPSHHRLRVAFDDLALAI